MFNGDQYAGGNLSIPWKAQPGPVVTDGSAVPLVLLVRLIGPFNHIDDLLGAIRKHKDDPDPSSMGSIVASSSPIGTDTWTNKTLTSVIHFPSDLRPGYDDLLLTATASSDSNYSTRADTVIFMHNHS